MTIIHVHPIVDSRIWSLVLIRLESVPSTHEVEQNMSCAAYVASNKIVIKKLKAKCFGILYILCSMSQ